MSVTIYNSNNKRKISVEKATQIVDYYKKCKNLSVIMKDLKVSFKTLKRVLIENNVPIVDFRIGQEPNRQYKLNDAFFEKIDSRDKAYILGLLFADGGLNSKYKQIKLKLTDIDLVKKVKEKLEYSGKLHYSNINRPRFKKAAALVICNKKIFSDLQKLGMKFRKSFDCQYPPPEILNGYDSDFLRGFFDGDGCISTGFSGGKHWSEIKIVSTKDFVKGTIDILSKLGIVSYEDYDRRIEKSKGIRDLRIRRLKDILRFRDFIYKDLEGQLYLERKFEHFKEVKIRREVMCL